MDIDRLRKLLEREIQAEEERAEEEAGEDFESTRDFGGNQDDAYEAGEESGTIQGRAELAAELLKMIGEE